MPGTAIQNAANASVISSAHSQDGDEFEHDGHPLEGRTFKSISEEAVLPLVFFCRKEIQSSIDTVLSYSQLQSPTVNFSVVRPLRLKLSSAQGTPPAALIYALLLNRQQFLAESRTDLAFAGLNVTRADLAELLAIKSLSLFGTKLVPRLALEPRTDPSIAGTAPVSLELLLVLTSSFNPVDGATTAMFEEWEGLDSDGLADLVSWGKAQSTNALELGIHSLAKRFVKSPLVQQVLIAIEHGKVLYSPQSSHSLLKDDYKARPVVEVYDFARREHPYLDYHLLRVPSIRNRIEGLTFVVILALFMLVQANYNPAHINWTEGLFIAVSLGFALDEFTALTGNGWTAYKAGALNLLDSVFCVNFFAYLFLRVRGLMTGDQDMGRLAFETLALAACVLLPRLSLALLKGNVILLALTAMIREFVWFMLLVIVSVFPLIRLQQAHFSFSAPS